CSDCASKPPRACSAPRARASRPSVTKWVTTTPVSSPDCFASTQACHRTSIVSTPRPRNRRRARPGPPRTEHRMGRPASATCLCWRPITTINKGSIAMRILFVLLALFSLGAQANPDWNAFPHDQSAFGASGDKLRQAWPRLTLGFGDYPFPDAAWVRRMAEENPEALQRTTAETGFSGAPGDAEVYAAELQEVWRLLFRGDFAEAKARGMAL